MGPRAPYSGINARESFAVKRVNRKQLISFPIGKFNNVYTIALFQELKKYSLGEGRSKVIANSKHNIVYWTITRKGSFIFLLHICFPCVKIAFTTFKKNLSSRTM